MPPAAQISTNKQASDFQALSATQHRTLPDPQSSPSRPEGRTGLEDAKALKPPNPYDPATNDTVPPPRRHSFTRRLLRLHDSANDFEPASLVRRRSASGYRKSHIVHDGGQQSSAPPMHSGIEHKKRDAETTPRPGLGPRPIGGHGKLGTFSGVFVPTCLNVLSIIMFLRFGFILGQGGVLGMMGSSRA